MGSRGVAAAFGLRGERVQFFGIASESQSCNRSYGRNDLWRGAHSTARRTLTSQPLRDTSSEISDGIGSAVMENTTEEFPDDGTPPGARMAEAYSVIKGAILQGRLTPGERMSQVKIAERLGLSRTPVREALRLIEREGLVTSARARQVVISSTSMADLDELYALRIKLDAMTVRSFVPKLTDADLDEMLACMHDMEANASSESFDQFDAAHRQFHMIAIRAAGPRHIAYSAQLNEHAERYRRLYMFQPNAYSHSKAEHEAIFAACKGRDGERVACLLAEHYARIALTIVAQFDPQYEPQLVRSALRLVIHDLGGTQGGMAAARR